MKSRILQAANSVKSTFARSGRATQGDYFKALILSAAFGAAGSILVYRPNFTELIVMAGVVAVFISVALFVDLRLRGRRR